MGDIFRQVKEIPIISILEKEGIKPDKVNSSGYWYKSPFRKEKTPSFQVNPERNIWNDHGDGEKHGNVIDLVMYLKDCNAGRALRILLDYSPGSLSKSSSLPEATKTPIIDTFKINKITDFNNPALVQYLRKRKIDIELVKRYLKVVYFNKGEKKYFGIGFQSNSGGYEIRNEYFKGCIGNKDISLIESENNNQIVSVFEGFIDFLSAVTHYNIQSLNCDVIVLNTDKNRAKAKKLIEHKGYKKVYCYFDNDEPGKEVLDFLLNNLDTEKIIDKSSLYAEYKDFNEFLVQES